jgi:hypothetical protein
MTSYDAAILFCAVIQAIAALWVLWPATVSITKARELTSVDVVVGPRGIAMLLAAFVSLVGPSNQPLRLMEQRMP